MRILINLLIILALPTLAGCIANRGFNSFAEGVVQGYSVGQSGVYMPQPRPLTCTSYPIGGGHIVTTCR